MTDPRRAPFEIFQQTVKYFPMPSVQLIVRNPQGETLFIKRKNAPARGEWWIPGGRVINGETIKDAAERVLQAEVGLAGGLVALSPEYIEELWPTEGFTEEDWRTYDPDTKYVHYLSVVAVYDVPEAPVRLDDQSDAVLWSKELLSPHPFLARLFAAAERIKA